MNFKTTLMLCITALLFSCSKNKKDNSSETLKAIPAAADMGLLRIKLEAHKSLGPITAYGWQLNIYSPTQPSAGSSIKWSPNSSHEGADFIPITATVPKKGIYNFTLIVYDKNKAESLDTISVEAK